MSKRPILGGHSTKLSYSGCERKTGFDKYFTDQMSDPEVKKAYRIACEEIVNIQSEDELIASKDDSELQEVVDYISRYYHYQR